MKRSRIIHDILAYSDLLIYIVTCSSHWAQKSSMLLIQLHELSLLLDFGSWTYFWVTFLKAYHTTILNTHFWPFQNRDQILGRAGSD